MSDFKMPDLDGLMQAAQKIQGDVARMQEELASKTCEASAGGGMVTAKVNGHYDLVSLTIDKQVVDPGDVSMLQDLVLAAVNDAIGRAKDLERERMASVAGGMGLPGMPGPMIPPPIR